MLPPVGSDRRVCKGALSSFVAVLAERLDHLRHLHLRNDLSDEWEARHAEVERAWAPFAARTDPRLVVRFDHWARTFGRRLRRP